MHRLPEHSFSFPARLSVSAREDGRQERRQDTPDKKEYFSPVAGRETLMRDEVEWQYQQSSQISSKTCTIGDNRRIAALQSAEQNSSPARRGSLLAELFSQTVDQTSRGDRAKYRSTRLPGHVSSSHTAIVESCYLEQEGSLPTTSSNDTRTLSYSPSEVDLLRRAAMLPRVEEAGFDRSLYEHMLALLWEGHPHVRATLQLKYPGVGLDEIVRQWEAQQGYTVDTSTWLPQVHGSRSLSCHTRGW